MAISCDAPHTRETEELGTDPLESLRTASAGKETDSTGDGEIVELFKLPVADIAGEEFDIDIASGGEDEFTCSSCFVVMHCSMTVIDSGDDFPVCRDCV